MIYSNYLILTIPIQFRFPKIVEVKKVKEEVNIANNEYEATKEISTSNIKKKFTIDDYCNFLDKKKTNNTDSFSYELEIDKKNALDNWSFKLGLYCENEYKKNYIISLIFLCSILSNLTMSLIADRFGRKFCLLIEIIGTILSFFVLFFLGPNNIYLLFFSIFTLQFFTHLFTVAYIYSFEFFHRKQYNWLFLFQNILFAILGILISYIVEKTKTLLYVELVTVFLAFLTLIFSSLYLLESPDWIISKMKHSENEINQIINDNLISKSEKIHSNFTQLKFLRNELILLKDELRVNYTKLLLWEDLEKRESKLELFNDTLNKLECFIKIHDDSEERILENNVENENTNTKCHDKKQENFIHFMKDLFNTKYIRCHFILSVYLWTVNQILYYSVITNLDRIENYISYSFEIYFLTQIFSNLILGYVFHYFNPKNIIYFSSITNFLNLIVGIFFSQNTKILILVFFIFTFLSSLTNQSIYIFVPELFDAKIRSTCVSYSKFPAKLLLIITPFLWGTNMTYLIIGLSIIIFFIPFLLYILYSHE